MKATATSNNDGEYDGEYAFPAGAGGSRASCASIASYARPDEYTRLSEDQAVDAGAMQAAQRATSAAAVAQAQQRASAAASRIARAGSTASGTAGKEGAGSGLVAGGQRTNPQTGGEALTAVYKLAAPLPSGNTDATGCTGAGRTGETRFGGDSEYTNVGFSGVVDLAVGRDTHTATADVSRGAAAQDPYEFVSTDGTVRTDDADGYIDVGDGPGTGTVHAAGVTHHASSVVTAGGS